MRRFRFLLSSTPSNIGAMFYVDAPTFLQAQDFFGLSLPGYFSRGFYSAEEYRDIAIPIPTKGSKAWMPILSD